MLKDMEKYGEFFCKLLKEQLKRAELIEANKNFVDYSKLKTIKIGILDGDGIGPVIVSAAEDILKFLLEEELKQKKVELIKIDGLTIENRAKLKETVPLEVLEKIKICNVILKGPTTTPRKGDGLPSLESANVVLRKELDLFANVRPIKIEGEGVDWVFFRENTEGSYTLGSFGLNISNRSAEERS